MFANEERGHKLPSRQILRNDGRPSREFIFNDAAVYPEYLNDFDVVWCPSFLAAVGPIERYDARIDRGSNGNGRVDNGEIVKEPFNYTGWLIMDDLNVLGHDLLAMVDPATGRVTGSTDPFGRFSEAEMALGPFGELGLESYATQGEASDRDYDFSSTFPGTQAGGGSVLYRLRHGIERFLITDINNPAGSATSASTIPVMWDHVTSEQGFMCHVPGGINVLYLDGHVDFLRYLGVAGTQFPATAAHAVSSGRYNHLFDGLGSNMTW
jgi:prepilin-type processing-associated H-X9-DG protein